MKNNWTTANIPDQRGKIMIVTEGDSSLGYEAAKAFSNKGAEVILACRNLKTGERIRTELLKQHPEAIIEVTALDLKDPGSIKQFASDFNKKYKQLDILMNISDHNTIPREETARVLGKPLGSDPSGHFVLTALLLNKLASTPDSRVVNMSVGEHKLNERDFRMMMRSRGHWNPKKNRIGSSRWANLFFTYELQKLFDTQNVKCAAVAAWPGPANRNLQRSMRNHWSWRLFKPIYRMFTGPDSLESALPGLRAASAHHLKGGEYFGPDGFVETSGYPSYIAVLRLAA